MLIEGIELDKNKYLKKIPNKLSMLFLRENNPEVSIEISYDMLVKFEEKIQLISQGIQNSEFTGIKGKHCEWCDYRELICPLFG